MSLLQARAEAGQPLRIRARRGYCVRKEASQAGLAHTMACLLQACACLLALAGFCSWLLPHRLAVCWLLPLACWLLAWLWLDPRWLCWLLVAGFLCYRIFMVDNAHTMFYDVSIRYMVKAGMTYRSFADFWAAWEH